jgi:hypothetical protein
MSLTFPIDSKLNDGSPVQLVLADERDVEMLRERERSRYLKFCWRELADRRLGGCV